MATYEQLQQFENRCSLTEQILAQTLEKRLEQDPKAIHSDIIRDWFKSVRDMAVANWITSDIKTTISE